MKHHNILFVLLILTTLANINWAKYQGKPNNYNKYQVVAEQKTNRQQRGPGQAEKLIQLTGNSGCVCVDYNCGCCTYMNVPEIGLNDTACVNVTYLSQEYGIRVTLTIDSWTFLNETISAKNPPPLCIDIPYLEKYADLCLRLYNMTYDYPNMGGCIEVEARLYHVFVTKYQLGCFHWDSARNRLEAFTPPLKALRNNSVFNRLRIKVRKFLVAQYRNLLQPIIYKLSSKSQTLKNMFSYILKED